MKRSRSQYKNKKQIQSSVKHNYFLRQTSMNKNIQPPTVHKVNNSLSGHTKPCGLFNSSYDESFKDDDDDETIIINTTYLNECNNTFSFDESTNSTMNKSSNDLIFENKININEFLSNNANVDVNTEILSPDMVKKQSKFLNKVEEQNLKIKIPPSSSLFNRQESLYIPLNDDDLKLITPNTENLCFQFLKSVTTPELLNLQTGEIDLMPMQTPTFNIQTADIDLSLIQTPSFLFQSNPFTLLLNHDSQQQQQQHQSEENTYISLTNVCDNKNDDLNESTKEIICRDHDYIVSPKKRNNSFLLEDSENESHSSESVKTPRSSNSQRKRQRTKGIYRANDVTNEDELANYLERRRKNNISSKVSRQSKKQQYVEMDEKSNTLEKENERLKKLIHELTNATKLVKDALLQQFTAK